MGTAHNLDQWDEFVEERYDQNRKTEDFRKYDDSAPAGVREFYRENHAKQTREFAQAMKRKYGAKTRGRMSIWEACEFLNTLVDESDPDTDLSQIQHLMQTSEAIRRDGHPRWMILTGFLHDLGKALCLYGEPQWAVVGDTFPVGCAWSDKIIFPEFFAANPDSAVSEYQTRLGVYQEGCGLDNVDLSWGHDEYLYQVVKDYLPEEGQYMIRYHSFYPWHREGAYGYLMNDRDRRMLPWVQKFNPYDLYSKSAAPPDVAELKPYYEELISEFFPSKIAW
uniref:Inositol oxygenase n=1 Tax=Solibacter usitatus (strain Ellin6076) TaxID=234267 RepID=Q01Z78_SOLUE